MWDLDSYTKQMYELPWEAPLLIDWVTEERHYTTPEQPAGGNHRSALYNSPAHNQLYKITHHGYLFKFVTVYQTASAKTDPTRTPTSTTLSLPTLPRRLPLRRRPTCSSTLHVTPKVGYYIRSLPFKSALQYFIMFVLCFFFVFVS